MFADENEGWVLIDFAGGQGLWIAERLGPDDVRMSYPGYIREIPLDFQSSADYMGSEHFIQFAVEQGWYEQDSGAPFDVSKIYGDDEARYPRAEMERELQGAAPVNLREFMNAVRDPRISKDATGYGQVARLKNRGRSDLNLLWVAPTGSVTAPFIPYRIGVQSIAPQFGKHRYLSKGEATRFLTPDWQIQEATEFAGRTFKRLMYFTCDHPDKFLPEVTEALTAFEDRLIEEQAAVADIAETLFAAGKTALARQYLTDYSRKSGTEALRLGNALLGSIEARTEVLFGYRPPQTQSMSELDYQLIKCLE
jgi:dipeptidase